MPILTKSQLDKFRNESEEHFSNAGVNKKNIASFSGGYPAPYGRRYSGIAPYLRPEREYPEPTRVSFFYFRFDESGSFTSRVYEAKNFSDLDQKVASFIQDGRRTNPTLPFLSDPNDVKWDSPTYVAIFLDNPSWELIDIPFQKEPGVFPSLSLHFLEIEGYSIPNSSFFEAENRTIEVKKDVTGATENVRYLSCKNYHLVPQTGDVRPISLKDRNNYKFDVFFSVEIADTASTLLMIVDPGGHNTGPDD